MICWNHGFHWEHSPHQNYFQPYFWCECHSCQSLTWKNEKRFKMVSVAATLTTYLACLSVALFDLKKRQKRSSDRRKRQMSTWSASERHRPIYLYPASSGWKLDRWVSFGTKSPIWFCFLDVKCPEKIKISTKMVSVATTLTTLTFGLSGLGYNLKMFLKINY